MDFQTATSKKLELEQAVDINSEKLSTYPRNAMGLILDSVKETAEYRADKLKFDISFANLQKFNRSYVKTFKTELAQARAKKYTSA